MQATNFIFEDEFQFSRQETLRLQRLRASMSSSGGWIIGERFDDRYDTEVGGFHQVVTQWIDERGQMQGGYDIRKMGEYPTQRRPSVIVDYGDNGKCYTESDALGQPELSSVIIRLNEREAKYVEFLAKKELEAEKSRRRSELKQQEMKQRNVRFLPKQVMRRIFESHDL